VRETVQVAMDEEELGGFRIYNSMTQQKEIFKTKTPGKVSMYVCGVTSYDFSHLGHARAAVSFDILYRYFSHYSFSNSHHPSFHFVAMPQVILLLSVPMELGI